MVLKPPVKKNNSHVRDQIINNAGQVASDKKKDKEYIRFHLRIPNDTLDKIIEDISDREGWYATTWIHEAIKEKIERRQKEKKNT